LSTALTFSAFAAVGIGAAIGAWLRWLLGLAWNATLPGLPLGTLVANLIGGYLIGIAVEWLRIASTLSPEWRLLVITGFLGGLTTFSTFSAESVDLIGHGRFGWALLHASVHLFGSIALTILGVLTVRAFS
jgi:fluoride exporter